MPDIGQVDEARTEKLRQWLESKGVDVAQVGSDLALPSPFKEREKRRTEGYSYVDRKRRLWVKVVTGANGIPQLIWQCWWSKSRGGKGLGGHSSYAVAMAAKVKREEIDRLLDLGMSEEVLAAETQEDKAVALIYQSIRSEQEKSILGREQRLANTKPTVARIPRDLPKNLVGLWGGSYLAGRGEEMIAGRGILPEIGKAYGLGWDCDRAEVVLPWLDIKGDFQFAQWWDGHKYRFDVKDGIHYQKEDGIFGLHLYRNERMVLAEGGFTAMSITGMALGGSTLTDSQIAIILSLSPKEIILAFDNDNGGFFGAKAILQNLKNLLPDTRVDVVMPPEGANDWNDVLKVWSFEKLMTEFAERVQYSRTMGPVAALATTFKPARSSTHD